MGKFGTTELLMILAVVLLIFGPKKLPELAKGMGEAVKEFKKGQKDLDDTINGPVITEDQKSDTTRVSKNVEVKDVTDEKVDK